MCVLSRVQLFATPWTVTHQAPLPMGFPRQEYCNGLPFPSPLNLPDSRILCLLHNNLVGRATWEAPIIVTDHNRRPQAKSSNPGSLAKGRKPPQRPPGEGEYLRILQRLCVHLRASAGAPGFWFGWNYWGLLEKFHYSLAFLGWGQGGSVRQGSINSKIMSDWEIKTALGF